MNLGDSHDKLVFLESDEGAEKKKAICACGMSVASTDPTGVFTGGHSYN
jgi:hypothetical protein